MCEIKNAKIIGTMLGYEDHGIFTCMISLDYGGGGQGFGGYRLGGEWGCQFIENILKTVGSDSWEKLIGKHVRVDCEWSKIHRIGHIIEDKWFDPQKDLKKYEPKATKKLRA